jgi:hypothetical protein
MTDERKIVRFPWAVEFFCFVAVGFMIDMLVYLSRIAVALEKIASGFSR